MNRRIIAVATLMLLVVMSLASCSDNDEDKTAGKVRQLTVVFSTGGLGDNGYNDKIMQGVMNFAGSHTDVETHIIRPHTLDEAREIYRNWLSYAANSNDSSLIVFASSEYSEVVRAESAPKGNNKVMLWVSTGPSRLTAGLTPSISTTNRKRANFLCGLQSAVSVMSIPWQEAAMAVLRDMRQD